MQSNKIAPKKEGSKAKESTKSKQVLQIVKQFFVKWKIFLSFLCVLVFIALFIWLLSVLYPKLTRGGIGGTATDSFGSGSGSREEFGNSDDDNHNKETGKKIHNMIVLTYSKVVLCT